MSCRDNSVPITLTGPAGVVVSDPNDSACLMWIEDCTFSSNVGVERVSRPQAHGSYQDSGFKDGGVWSSTWRLIGGGAKLEANRVRLARVINSMLGDQGTGQIRWCNQGSDIPQRLTGLQLIDDQARIDGGSMVWQIQLASERPAGEDETATTVDSAALSAGGGGFSVPLTIPFTITASAGGTLTLTNSGTFYAFPVLRIYGPATAPRITNTRTGQSLVWTGSIAAGDYWEIDTFRHTVKSNGVTSVTSIDVANSDWFALGIGDTTLQLSAQSYSTSTLLRAYMRSGWA